MPRRRKLLMYTYMYIMYMYMDGCAHNAPPCMRTTRKNEMVGWTDTGLIWWDSTTVLPVLHGTIGQDGQGFFRAVVAVLHGTMGTDTIGYYSTYAMGKDNSISIYIRRRGRQGSLGRRGSLG